MTTVSIFQHLPPHVVELIINYFVYGSFIKPEWTIGAAEEHQALLKPLLWVCSNFRAIALPLFCRYFSLNLGSPPLDGQKPQHICKSNLAIGYPTHRLAKYLVFNIDEWDVYTGESLKTLSLAPYNDYTFPSTRAPMLSFASNPIGEASEPSPLAIGDNIKAFVRWIHQMAPMVVEVIIHYYPLYSQNGCSHYLGSLASQLFQLASCVAYGHGFEPDAPIRLQLDSIQNLVKMWFMAESYNCPTIALARKNAPTLQYLVITSEYPANLAGLIQNPDGSYVTFPCMYVLKFRDGSEDRVPERVTFWGAVPFPRLRHIESDSSYPFGDDVLFRGNSGTLEHLELLISDLLVSIIIEYNVFTPTGHPNLRRVLTKYPVDEMPIFFDTTADALQFMLSIGSGAPRRELEGDHSSSDLAPAFLSTLNHASIQVLTLSNFIPELADVIALISSLPALSNLRTSPPVIGSITNDVDRDKLPSYILSTYAPVSRRFRYLDHLRFQMTYRLDNVRCVLLVALAYPNYTYSDQDGGVGKRLKNELKRVIASDMFKPHVSRLQSFLNNCIGSL